MKKYCPICQRETERNSYGKCKPCHSVLADQTATVEKYEAVKEWLRAEIERKDAAIAELKAENRALSNRAIDCEMSWTHERAERAEMAIAELVAKLSEIVNLEPAELWHYDTSSAEQLVEKYKT